MASRIWFLDGTFETAPAIFMQVFAILGSCSQTINGETREFALPFVYALLSSKKENAYQKVLEVVNAEAVRLGALSEPQFLLVDFELGIINACLNVFETSVVKSCFFHLSQNIFRRVQSEGPQRAYNAEDRSVRNAAHMLTALAFLPADDVANGFDELLDNICDQFLPVAEYFEVLLIYLINIHIYISIADSILLHIAKLYS